MQCLLNICLNVRLVISCWVKRLGSITVPKGSRMLIRLIMILLKSNIMINNMIIRTKTIRNLRRNLGFWSSWKSSNRLINRKNWIFKIISYHLNFNLGFWSLMEKTSKIAARIRISKGLHRTRAKKIDRLDLRISRN